MPLPALAVPAVLKRISPKIWAVLGVLVLIGLLIWFVNRELDQIHDDGVKEGVAMERAAWEEADRRIHAEAAAARTAADASAAKREARHAAAVEAERKEIHEAHSEGRSPLDALFN